MNEPREATRRGFERWRIDHEANGQVKIEWAEKFLLGTLLVFFDKHYAELDDFEESHLHVEFHQSIFRAMIELREDNMPVNPLTVAERLQETGNILKHADPIHYLLELADNSEGWAEGHVWEWCRIVSSKAALTQFKRDLSQLEDLADRGSDVDDLRARLARLADKFPRERHAGLVTMRESVATLAGEICRGSSETVSWGIDAIDDACRGFAFGELVIIGGRPSQGKSMILCQWLDTVAAHKQPSILISEEMTATNLAKRMLQSIMPIDATEWAKDEQRLKWEAKNHFENRADVFIAESCGKMDKVERVVGNAVDKCGVKVVGLDYAQLIKGDGRTKYEQVSDVSTRCKRLATKYGVIFILLAQLGRGADDRTDFIPKLSDLKDSGQLEQDADVVLFAVWPAKANPSYKDANEYRIHQAKNRSRGIGNAMIEMSFNPARQRLTTRHPADNF